MSPIDRPTAISTRASVSRVSSRTSWARVAERQPNGELARLFGNAGQVQVGHVRAADREHDERQRQKRNHEREDLDRGVVRPESVSADARRGVGARGGLRATLAMPCRCETVISWRSTSTVVRPAFPRPTTVSQPVSSDGRVGHCGARARYPRLHAVRVILAGVEGLHPVEARRRHADDGERRSAKQHGRPMASSRPSRWVRQKYSVTTATGAAAGRSSSSNRRAAASCEGP